ncbi:MAG: trypsin-like peptidase domain-containing protein [Oscillospiraceae bacterium]|jgi:hypothetical protein|nr:trypsin-like peptidase domain-containing protein [Oscillospiraceae bacterium]
MKFFKKAMVAMLIVTALALGTVSAFAAPETFRDTPDGVVLIEWSGSVLSVNPVTNAVIVVEGTWHGTGFFVGGEDGSAQYIVTNYHVIEDFLNVEYVEGSGAKAKHPITVIYGADNEQAYVVDYDAEKDIAVLKISAPTDKRVPLTLRQASSELRAIDVWAVGYPVISDNYMDAVSSYGKDDATFTKGTLGRTIVESGTGRTIYQTDVKISGGNSGGPLVDEFANVIGINTFSVSNLNDFDSTLYYAVSVDDLIPILTRNNIPYTKSEGADNAAEGPAARPKTLFIIAGAAAVVIIAAVVILLVTKSKKAPKAHATPVQAAPVTAPVSAPVNAPLRAANGQSPVLHSVSAQHNGISVPLGRQPITLGRDVAACRIVFRDGTNGVSSKHCEIYFDEKENTFVLTDLKSTYGTFLSNGQRLTPSVPYRLNPRDSFYLGEPDNALYVDFENAVANV